MTPSLIFGSQFARVRFLRGVRAVLVAGLLWLLVPVVLAAQTPSFGLPATDRVFDTQALRILAEQGDKRAAFLLGSRYASGHGVPRDDSEAVRWFTLAAEGGLAEAQYNLGIMYATGRGVPPEPAKAVYWYERAAQQDLAEAQFNLGTLYGTGRGVRRDEALAVKWLTRAAQHGLARAQYNLGALYEHGRGVRVNVHTALEWYRKAEQQGLEQAGLRRAALAKKMRIDSQQGAGQEAGPVAAVSSAEPLVAASPGAKTPSTTASIAKPAVSATSEEDWLRHAPAGQFTMQLASFTSRVDAQRFARTLPDELPVGIYESAKGDKLWFSVVRGIFKNRAAAAVAVSKLPAKLRKMKPWVRNIGQLHKQMR